MSGRAHRARAAVTLRRTEGLLPYPSEITADALFPIYSVTKTLTAACVFLLAEENLMSLDAPIGLYVSDVPLPEGVTVSRLLRHTSGLGDYGPFERYHAAVRASPSIPWTRSEFLEAVLLTGFLFRPGEGWAYSNIGYMLLTGYELSVTTFARLPEDMLTVAVFLDSSLQPGAARDIESNVMKAVFSH
ncbi:MAG TPA: serine hydrolase domain-containing protein [Gemmatimonadaceae bacterium]